MDAYLNSDDFDRKGFDLYESGNLDGALRIYEEGLSLFPFTPELHSGKGHMCLYLCEFVEALQSFHRGLSINPLDPELNKGAALSLLYLNRPQEARVYLQRAVPQFREDEHALFEMAFALFQIGQYDDSQDLFDFVSRLDKTYTDAHLYKALCMHHIGRNDAGKYLALDTALALEPGRFDVIEHFANILYDDGLTDQAGEFYKQLRVDDVNDETTLERALELFANQRGMFRKRWAIRRRLKELRRTDPVEDFIQDLRLEWESPTPAP